MLDYLYIYGDESATEIARRKRLDRKTVFGVLRVLWRDGFVIHERNKAKYHLPQENYSKAMRRYGWRKERWPVLKLQRRAQEIDEWAVAMSRKLSFLQSPEVQKLLNAEAKRYLFFMIGQLSLTDQVSLVDRLQEGTICLECLNNGEGFQVSSFDNEGQVYVCEKCGIGQSQGPFASVGKSDQKGGKLRVSLPSGVRASLILE